MVQVVRLLNRAVLYIELKTLEARIICFNTLFALKR